MFFIKSILISFLSFFTSSTTIIDDKETNKAWTLALQKDCTDHWSIHGLWPNWGDYCHVTRFNISSVEPIEDKLKVNWKSCYHSNEYFWSHEWYKHGCCTRFSELKYFSLALNLRDIYYTYCNEFNKSKRCRLCLDYDTMNIIPIKSCHVIY